MALFSQRKGIRPLRKDLQRESMDDELRNGLWNGLQFGLWNYYSSSGLVDEEDNEKVQSIATQVWVSYLKSPVDEMPRFGRSSGSVSGTIRSRFFESEWWEVYDLIEFLIARTPDRWKNGLTGMLNVAMENENAAYRIVGDTIVDITDEYEITAIESALETGTRETQAHLSRALDFVSDRKKPDYRNSIKESVSAVEAACRVLAGIPKATLGDCVKVLKSRGTLHPAFEQALLKLYGYTSDEGGIRHALTDDGTEPSFADAKFMLVSCSAFVNYVWGKASELGIRISG